MENLTSYQFATLSDISNLSFLFNLVCTPCTLNFTFLYNHPGRDTAGDIVELRMLSKGNVSKAVEALIQKELIQREQDEKDRRKIHLSLLPAAEPMILALEEKQREFSDAIFSGFSKEEKQLFHEMNSRIAENTLGIMKRSNLK